MNITILSGRITDHPDVRMTGSGKKVCQFTLAVDDGKDTNGQRKTQFLDCVAWENGAAYLEQYVKKGNRISVQGRLNKSSYLKDGEKRYSVKVVCDRVEFADGANQPRNEEKPMITQNAPKTAQNEPVQNAYDIPNNYGISDDDLPF